MAHAHRCQWVADLMSTRSQAAPLIDLWPRIVARCAVPLDTQALLVAKLEKTALSDRSIPDGSGSKCPMDELP
jgi:hypothetical protein